MHLLPYIALFEGFDGMVREFYTIGGCRELRLIDDIADGSHVARTI